MIEIILIKLSEFKIPTILQLILIKSFYSFRSHKILISFSLNFVSNDNVIELD